MVETYTLNDGLVLPAVGFGTYPLSGDDGVAAVRSAIEAGYRLLDTAVNYGNEAEVGRAMRESGADDLLVTSKVPGRDHGFDETIASVQGSLDRLGRDVLDLALIHWPNPSRDRYVDAWRGLVECRSRGLARSIGVSNFTEAHLTRIIDETGEVPSVNQLEVHPLFPQEEMLAVDERLGIRTEAWSPLGKRQGQYADPAVAGPAERLGVTPGQVILRWHVERGTLPIPKSADAQRQRDNLALFDFSLTPEEVAAITALGRPDGRLFGGDPDTHEEM
jgi:diketogulonate reductase-like aldo/keto reductase